MTDSESKQTCKYATRIQFHNNHISCFLKIQKEERNLTELPLPILRITDPEDRMQFSAAGLDYCPHIILGNEKNLAQSLWYCKTQICRHPYGFVVRD